MGGTGEIHLEWGGTRDDHPKWGGCTQVPPKMGGDSCAAEGRAKKGTPPSACFWHLPLHKKINIPISIYNFSKFTGPYYPKYPYLLNYKTIFFIFSCYSSSIPRCVTD